MLRKRRARRNLIRLVLVLAGGGAAACADDMTSDPGPEPDLPGLSAGLPPAELAPRTPVAPPGGGRVPGASGSLRFFEGGDFVFEGDLAPGTASFDGAPIWDEASGGEPATGGGAFDVTLDGVSYAAPAAMTLAAVFPDEFGAPYLVLAGLAFEPIPGTGTEYAKVIYVVVPASDFAVGATIALDGAERAALFAAGPAEAEAPEIVGAAISGTVTFVAGGLAVGDTVTATLSAEFGAIDWEEPTDPPPPPPPPPGSSIVAGAYELAFLEPADVYCDGAALAGHEADFAAIGLAEAGFTDGPVDVATPTTETVTVTGDTLAGGYGGTSLTLDHSPSDPPGMYAGWASRSELGPSGTTMTTSYLAVDGSTASPELIRGFAGVVFESGDGSSFCVVGFGAVFTAP